MRFFTVSASAALLMLGTAAASAQTAQTAPDAYDDAQDQTAATQRFLDRTFGNIDENRDGTIDRPEWDAFMTDWLAERRERFDSRFKEADTNGDGYLDRNEADRRSEEHTSAHQSLMRTSYAVFCLNKKQNNNNTQK